MKTLVTAVLALLVVIGLVVLIMPSKGPKPVIATAEPTFPTEESESVAEQPPPEKISFISSPSETNLGKAEIYRDYIPDILSSYTEDILRETAEIDSASEEEANESETFNVGIKLAVSLAEQGNQEESNAEVARVAEAASSNKVDQVCASAHERLKSLLGNKYPIYLCWEEVRWLGPELEEKGLPKTEAKKVVTLLTDMKLRGDRNAKKIFDFLSSRGEEGKRLYKSFHFLFEDVLTPPEEKLRSLTIGNPERGRQ